MKTTCLFLPQHFYFDFHVQFYLARVPLNYRLFSPVQSWPEELNFILSMIVLTVSKIWYRKRIGNEESKNRSDKNIGVPFSLEGLKMGRVKRMLSLFPVQHLRKEANKNLLVTFQVKFG